MVRFFLAHPKSDPPRLLEQRLAIARRAVEPRSRGKPFQIVLGRDDYEAHFSRCGSWEAWAQDVAAGIDAITREPRYHGILVPLRTVGAATARIVECALAVRKSVLAFDPDSRISRVAGLLTEDEDDWQQGYRLFLETDPT